MAAVADFLSRPFTGVWRRVRSAGWPARIAMALALIVGLPVLFVVVVYLLPPRTAVALGEPVLALLSDRPPLPGDLDPVSERSVVLAADGSELATLYDEVNRVRVSLDDVADVAVEALLAAEDDAFYEHPGIDHRAVIRAAVVNFRSGDVEQGGSTLTQQLVKNVYLEPSQTVRRKLTEAWYALQLEERLTKREIIQRYLNEAYFGQGAHGIEAASQLYFNTPAAELTEAQAALLIGVIPSPTRLNPLENPEGARDARDRVLDRMVVTGRLDRSTAEEAKSQDLGLDHTPPPPPNEPFFVEYVKRLLLHSGEYDDLLGTEDQRESVVYRGGLTVHTTLDPRLQKAANAAIADVMGDPRESPLATIVTVQPNNGAVRALAVGPKEFGRCRDDASNCPRTMVNPAVPGLGGSGRQPGSAFKPFVLAAALTEGVPPGWQQRTADGKAIEGCDDDGEPYRPRNYSEDPGIKAMPEAIRVSNNVYHAKLAGLLGPELLVRAGEAAGLRGAQLPEQCSVALGSGSVYPLEMALGFATFTNKGVTCRPLVITKIELGPSAGGGEEEFGRTCDDAFEPDVAERVTDLLQEPVESGTGTAAQLDRPVAGKTGTTDDYKDAWFIGYVPQLATSVWVGFERPAVMEDVLGVAQVTGGSIPARLWHEYMSVAVEPLDAADFPNPDDPDPVEVPDFRRKNADDIEEEYEEDYTFNIELREVRHWREAGTVVRQRPAPETRVAPGRLVTLFVSDGRGELPQVPDVVGMRRQRAERVLSEARYRVNVEQERQELGPEERPPEPEGTVIRQSPQGGSRLEPREEVTIVIVTYERREPEDDEDDDEDEDRPPRPDGDDADDPLPDPTDDPAPARSRQVKFGRIVADPDGDDLEHNAGEYVTIVSGRSPIDVSGWSIEYEGGRTLMIGDGYRMPPGSELAVHTASGTNRPPRRYFNGYEREVLADDGGVLILRDRDGREVTRREY